MTGNKANSNLGLMSALAYGIISIAITLNNKAVLSTYGYSSTMTLTLLQGLVTIIALLVMRNRGYIDFPAFDLRTARKVAPLSFVFIAYVVISLVSLGRVNVPMFTALRRVTIVFVMIEEFYMLGIVPSRRVINSVAVMCIGAAIAAWRDMTFDIVSYFFLFLTNLFTSLYTVYINVVKKETNLNAWAMMFYNNIITMPALFVIAWATGDLQAAFEFKHYGDWFFQLNFQASIFLAFLLNVATFYCTMINSARTQTVVGQLKNFFAFLLGLVLFSDYVYDPLNFAGLIVGFAGGVQYSYVTYAEKQEKDALKAKAPAPAEENLSLLSPTAVTVADGSEQTETTEAVAISASELQADESETFALDHGRGLLPTHHVSSTSPGAEGLRAR